MATVVELELELALEAVDTEDTALPEDVAADDDDDDVTVGRTSAPDLMVGEAALDDCWAIFADWVWEAWLPQEVMSTVTPM